MARRSMAIRLWALGPSNRIALDDLRRVPISDGVWATVGWIDRPGEVGPTCSVHASGIEVLRCDLFEQVPHVHPLFAATHGADLGTMRWRPPPPGTDELIEWVRREMATNLDVHLRADPSRRRPVTPTRDEMAAAADRVADELVDLVHRHATAAT